MTKECRPPEDTADGTYHWLAREGDKREVIAQWLKGAWYICGTGQQFTPYNMGVQNYWEYIWPVSKPLHAAPGTYLHVPTMYFLAGSMFKFAPDLMAQLRQRWEDANSALDDFIRHLKP